MKKFTWIAACVSLLIFIGCMGQPEKQKENQKNKNTTNHIETITKTDVTQIFAEYATNQIAADNKYKGKIVRVSGVIDKIGTSTILGIPFVDLKNFNQQDMFGVHCEFPRKDKDLLTGLLPGSNVKIQGKCMGKLGLILFTNCQLVQ